MALYIWHCFSSKHFLYVHQKMVQKVLVSTPFISMDESRSRSLIADFKSWNLGLELPVSISLHPAASHYTCFTWIDVWFIILLSQQFFHLERPTNSDLTLQSLCVIIYIPAPWSPLVLCVRVSPWVWVILIFETTWLL